MYSSVEENSEKSSPIVFFEDIVTSYLPPGPMLPTSANFHPMTAWLGGNQTSILIMAFGGGTNEFHDSCCFEVLFSFGCWFKLSQLELKYRHLQLELA